MYLTMRMIVHSEERFQCFFQDLGLVLRGLGQGFVQMLFRLSYLDGFPRLVEGHPVVVLPELQVVVVLPSPADQQVHHLLVAPSGLHGHGGH